MKIRTNGNWEDVMAGYIYTNNTWKLFTTVTGTVVIGDRGIFGGGNDGSSNDTIDYITISTLGNSASFADLTVGRQYISATSNGATDRGIFIGGDASPETDTIDYVTISTPSNATDFGNLTEVADGTASTSNGTNDRGIRCGGFETSTPITLNTIDYVTISTPSNATDFGDLTETCRFVSCCSNGTYERGIAGGGRRYDGSWTALNVINYVTINSTGNATDFGDLTVSRFSLSGTSNGTNGRGVFAGGSGPLNTIDYITINSTGNATDFGDLTAARFGMGGTSNRINERGIFGGGKTTVLVNTIDYITINSTGNATDFGDLTAVESYTGATSNA